MKARHTFILMAAFAGLVIGFFSPANSSEAKSAGLTTSNLNQVSPSPAPPSPTPTQVPTPSPAPALPTSGSETTPPRNSLFLPVLVGIIAGGLILAVFWSTIRRRS